MDWDPISHASAETACGTRIICDRRCRRLYRAVHGRRDRLGVGVGPSGGGSRGASYWWLASGIHRRMDTIASPTTRTPPTRMPLDHACTAQADADASGRANADPPAETHRALDRLYSPAVRKK